MIFHCVLFLMLWFGRDLKLIISLCICLFYRPCYFSHEDKNELNDWVASTIRSRFHSIQEERDAYQCMQREATTHTDEIMKHRQAVIKECALLKQQCEQEEVNGPMFVNLLQVLLIDVIVSILCLYPLLLLNRFTARYYVDS